MNYKQQSSQITIHVTKNLLDLVTGILIAEFIPVVHGFTYNMQNP
jgi:hypothetical protein